MLTREANQEAQNKHYVRMSIPLLHTAVLLNPRIHSIDALGFPPVPRPCGRSCIHGACLGINKSCVLVSLAEGTSSEQANTADGEIPNA